MEVKKIVEGMTAVEVAEVIDSNFKSQNKILEEDIAKQNSVIGVSEYKDFSEAEAVNVGDVRKYNGFLYKCVEATTGAFDASKWKKSSFKAETEKKLSELNLNVSKVIKVNKGAGYNIDGMVIHVVGEWYASSAKEIDPTKSYVLTESISGYTDTLLSIAFFDKNMDFISGSDSSYYKGYILKNPDIPINAKYIGLTSYGKPEFDVIDIIDYYTGKKKLINKEGVLTTSFASYSTYAFDVKERTKVYLSANRLADPNGDWALYLLIKNNGDKEVVANTIATHVEDVEIDLTHKDASYLLVCVNGDNGYVVLKNESKYAFAFANYEHRLNDLSYCKIVTSENKLDDSGGYILLNGYYNASTTGIKENSDDRFNQSCLIPCREGDKICFFKYDEGTGTVLSQPNLSVTFHTKTGTPFYSINIPGGDGSVVAPKDAYYVSYPIYKANIGKYMVFINYSTVPTEYVPYVEETVENRKAIENLLILPTSNVDVKNQWYGKKIVWLGTSIPYGQTSEPDVSNPMPNPYPTIVGGNLSANVINVARPGMAIETTSDFKRKEYGSLSLSVAELAEQGHSATPYQSYENALLGHDADLYVFDCEPNNQNGDLSILDEFDFARWQYNDGSSFASHRDSYIGAMIFLIDKLWTEKPSAKVVFVSEYGTCTVENWNKPYKIREATIELSKKLKIGFINLWDKLYYNKQNLSLYMNTDNVHPKVAAHKRMAAMLTNELLLID